MWKVLNCICIISSGPRIDMTTTFMFPLVGLTVTRGELSYLAPLGSEKISAPYFKLCFFREGEYYPPDSQTPRLPVPRQK